jgi:hypothetical protein
MPYKFTFDLSRLPKSFFKEVVKISHRTSLHKKIEKKAQFLIKKFRIQEITGLNISNAIKVITDLLDVEIKNVFSREKFLKAKRNNRALFLPHCSRKHMDKRCKASFDPKVPSFFCAGCSPDCLINKATALGKKKGYDVYVLPGGSCVPEILEENLYDAIAAVACPMELELGVKFIETNHTPVQMLPLIKNGCSNTSFSIKDLKKIL